MSERQVRIVISGEAASLIRAAQQAEGALGRIGQQGERAGSQVSSFGDKLRAGLEAAGVAVGLAGVAAAIGKTITVGRAFEDNLNQLQAVSGATANEMQAVSARARELGNDLDLPTTSASDAAEAMLALSKGGLSVAESMAAAKGTLTLAAAAQVSGAQAAEIQANALNAFGLSADKANMVADVLANTANAASGEITDFAQALAQSSGVANMFGVDIDDTATVLGIFAKAGLQGSDAGTSLKTSLLAMLDPTLKQKSAIEQLGLTIFDAQGNFVGMRTITDQLSTAQQTLTQEQFNTAAAVVFGSDAVRAASFLAQGGAAAYDEMNAAVNRAGGAQEVAAATTKGLSGEIGKFQSKLEDVALNLYGNFSPALESAVGFATGAVGVFGDLASWFGELPGPVQAAAISLGAVVILAGPLNALWAGMGAKLVAAGAAWTAFSTRVAAASGVMARAGILAGAAAGALGGPLGIALVAGATALALFAGSSDDAAGATADFTGAIDENTGSLTENAQTVIARAAAESGAAAAYKAAGGNVADYTAALAGNADKQEEVRRVLADAASAAEDAGTSYDLAAVGADGMGAATGESVTVLGEQSGAFNNATTASKQFEADLAAVNDAQAVGKLAAEGTAGAIDTQVAAATDAVSPMEAMAEATKLAAENAKLLAENTGVEQALSGAARAADDASRALDFLLLKMIEFSGRNLTAEEAANALNSALRGVESAFEDGTKAATENTEAGDLNIDALKNWDVAALTATESGSQMYDQLNDLVSAHAQTTSAAYLNAIASGDVAGAQGIARTAAQKSRDAFLELTDKFTGNREESVRLADRLGVLDGVQIDDKLFDAILEDQVAKGKLTTLQAQEIRDKQFAITAQDNATYTIDNIQAALNAMQTYKQVEINTIVRTTNVAVEDGGILAYANGGVHAANGLYGRGLSQVRAGSGGGVTWAEAGTGREFYLSMKPGMRERNQGLAAQAVKELGGQATFGDRRRPAPFIPQMPGSQGSASNTYTGQQGGVQGVTINNYAAGDVLSELDYAMARL